MFPRDTALNFFRAGFCSYVSDIVLVHFSCIRAWCFARPIVLQKWRSGAQCSPLGWWEMASNLIFLHQRLIFRAPGFAPCFKRWLRMTVSHLTLAWSCLLYFSLSTVKCKVRLRLTSYPTAVCSAKPDTREKHDFLQAHKPTGDQSNEGLLGSLQRGKVNAGWLWS